MRSVGKSCFLKIYQQVKKIPLGEVSTYGRIARKVGTDPRVVGWALHGNRDPQVPCHRVVNKEGRLAPNFGWGGWQEQKKKLLAEGVRFKNQDRVDLEKHLVG